MPLLGPCPSGLTPNRSPPGTSCRPTPAPPISRDPSRTPTCTSSSPCRPRLSGPSLRSTLRLWAPTVSGGAFGSRTSRTPRCRRRALPAGWRPSSSWLRSCSTSWSCCLPWWVREGVDDGLGAASARVGAAAKGGGAEETSGRRQWLRKAGREEGGGCRNDGARARRVERCRTWCCDVENAHR